MSIPPANLQDKASPFPLQFQGRKGGGGQRNGREEDGSAGTTETVYFHQKTPWSAKSGVEPENEDEKFYRKHGPKGWQLDHDYSDLVGYTDESFDSDVWEKYLQHHPIEMLHGFSFAKSVPWNIGEVVMFETSRIHCSSYMEDCFGKDCFLVKVNTDLWD